MGTGTGKTITSLYRASTSPTKNLLVICPHSVLGQWKAVIEEHFEQYNILEFKKTWSAKRKNEQLLSGPDYNAVIINFEIVSKMTSLKLIVNQDWTIIVDESHRIKAMGTKREPVVVTHSVLALKELTPWKMILTATPAQAGYEDYYPQLNFLGYIDYSYDQFKSRYCIEQKISVRHSPYPIKQIVGYKNTKELDDLLKICCRKYEAKFGDFEPQHIRVDMEYPEKYAKTKRERVYGGIVINNFSRLRIALKTMCTGTILGMDMYNQHIVYEDNKEKINWLMDFLGDTDEKVAVYYNYNVELKTLSDALTKAKIPFVVVNGDTKDKYATVNRDDYRVLLGQYQSASEALDGLQFRSHIMVLFALPESSLLYKQAIGRINRDGQTKVPMYYYLVTKDTIEDNIYEMINEKVEFTEDILNNLLMEE